MKAIEDGLYTRTTKERLEALETREDELTVKIADEKLKKPSFNEISSDSGDEIQKVRYFV